MNFKKTKVMLNSLADSKKDILREKDSSYTNLRQIITRNSNKEIGIKKRHLNDTLLIEQAQSLNIK